jgi:hypothetical protein
MGQPGSRRHQQSSRVHPEDLGGCIDGNVFSPEFDGYHHTGARLPLHLLGEFKSLVLTDSPCGIFQTLENPNEKKRPGIPERFFVSNSWKNFFQTLENLAQTSFERLELFGHTDR